MHTLGMLGLSPVALSNKREAKNHSENFLLQRRCGRVIIAKLFERELKSTNGLWRSLVAHLTGGQGVAGSNPAGPTRKTRIRMISGFLFKVVSLTHAGKG